MGSTGFAPVPGMGFSEQAGPFFQKIEAGRLYRGLRIAAKHTNRLGIAHGGLLLTFADTLLGATLRHGLGNRPAEKMRQRILKYKPRRA